MDGYISSFLAVNPEVDYILALTNGTFVFLNFCATSDNGQINIPTGYECSFNNGYVYGSGFNQETGEVSIIVAEENMIHDILGSLGIEGTIMYPIA